MHIRICISAIPFHPTLPLVEGNCRNAHTCMHFSNFLPTYPPAGGRKLMKCTYVCAFLQILPPYPPPGGRKLQRNAHTYVHFCHFPPTYPPAGGRKLHGMRIRMCTPAIPLNPTLPLLEGELRKCTYVCAFLRFASTLPSPWWKEIAEMHRRMWISAISFHRTHPLVEGNCRSAHTYVHFCNLPPPGGG